MNQSDFESILQLLLFKEKYLLKLQYFLDRKYLPKGQFFNLIFPKRVSLPLGGSLWMAGEKLGEREKVSWE